MRRSPAALARAVLLTATFGAASLGAIATSTGCAAADGMQEKLYDATRGYNRSLRWSDWDRAAEHLPPESVDVFLDTHDGVDEQLVVLDYNLTRLKLDKNTGRAACRVEISWHTDERLIVESTTVDQWWQFYEGQWYLVDERRVAGTPLTIFAERADETPDDGVVSNIESDVESDVEGDVEANETVAARDELPHPYLPGLDAFRDSRDIGLSDKEQRKRDKARRKGARRAKKQGLPDPEMDFGAPASAASDPAAHDPATSSQASATSLRGW